MENNFQFTNRLSLLTIENPSTISREKETGYVAVVCKKLLLNLGQTRSHEFVGHCLFLMDYRTDLLLKQIVLASYSVGSD